MHHKYQSNHKQSLLRIRKHTSANCKNNPSMHQNTERANYKFLYQHPAKSRQLTEKCGMHIKCGKRITKIQRFHYGAGGAIIYIHRVRQYRSVYCPDIISGVPSKILLCSMKPAAKRHQKDYCCKQNPSVVRNRLPSSLRVITTARIFITANITSHKTTSS